MSIAETIQQRVEQMSEVDQLKLLEYANRITHLQGDVSETDIKEYDRLLKELLLKRYQQAKAHPERSVSWEDVQNQIRTKYGW